MNNFSQRFQKMGSDTMIIAEENLLKQVADEIGVSEKCAQYYISKHFNLEIGLKPGVDYDDILNSPHPVVCFTLKPKSVEVILAQIDEDTDDEDELELECLREIVG